MRNFIASFHIIIIPLMIYYIYQETILYSFLAILLLFLSVFISFIEWLALKKKRDKESFLKPFKDKLILFILLLVFVIRNSFSTNAFIIFVLRDLIIGIIRLRAARDNINVKGKIYGKLLTFFQFFIVFGLLIKNFLLQSNLDTWIPMLNFIIVIFTALAFIVVFSSIAHFFSSYIRQVRKKRKVGTLIEKEEMVLLANKKSGGYKNLYRRRLLKKFAKKRDMKIIYLPNKKDMFEGISKEIKNFKQIIIAGGDGSFESALNCNDFKNKSLGFFPLGAGNSYYSYFYKGNRFEYLRSRFQFSEVPLDILEFEWDEGKLQTTFLAIGIDAEVTREIKNVKNHEFKDYFIAGAKVTFGPRRAYNIKCIIDGKKHHWDNCFNLIISKIPFIGYGLKSVIGKVKMNDGKILGLANVNTHSPIFNKALRLWTVLLTQLNLNKAPIVPLKGKEFSIKSDKPFPIQAGGDFVGYTKTLNVKVLRKQKVLVI